MADIGVIPVSYTHLDVYKRQHKSSLMLDQRMIKYVYFTHFSSPCYLFILTDRPGLKLVEHIYSSLMAAAFKLGVQPFVHHG